MRWLSVCIALCSFAAQSQVEASVRGRERADLTVESADAAGVRVLRDGSEILLPWSAVRELTGDVSPELRGFEAGGEALWRGSSRLDRGDPIAALEPLEQAFDRFKTHNGATTGEAADALLAARLRLGDAQGGVVPWLVRMEQDDRLPTAPTTRRVEIDPVLRLLPELPPIFIGSRPAPRVASELAQDGFGRWSAGPNRKLAEIYATALLLAAGERPPPLPEETDLPGVRLAWAMVEARQPDQMARASARRVLRTELASAQEPWIRAWCHAGIGLSLLLESQRERLAGVGHLLVVPSIYGETQPHLAGICLAESARVLYEAGREQAASDLVEQLSVLSPSHPSLTLPTIRSIRLIRTEQDSEAGT